MMLRKTVWLATAIVAAAPATASAACAAQPAPVYPDAVPLVFVGRALDGPFAPAHFQVLAYEKGSGPARVAVDTGQSRSGGAAEGISPHAGELWRIYGRVEGDRVITGACFNAHPIIGPLTPPALRLAGRTVTGAPSTLAGDTSPARAPSLRTRRSSVRVVSSRPLAYVRVMRRGEVLATATASPDGTWTVPLPRGTSRLVADTGDRAYAVAVRRLARR